MIEKKLETELGCLFGHCKEETRLMIKLSVGQIAEKMKLMKEFKEGKLKKQDYIKKSLNLEKKMYICDDFNKMGKCALDNCGSFMKIKLDKILDNLNKSKMKKDKYTVADYCKIHWLERKDMMEREFKEKLK